MKFTISTQDSGQQRSRFEEKSLINITFPVGSYLDQVTLNALFGNLMIFLMESHSQTFYPQVPP
jgi:hypothetical protein